MERLIKAYYSMARSPVWDVLKVAFQVIAALLNPYNILTKHTGLNIGSFNPSSLAFRSAENLDIPVTYFHHSSSLITITSIWCRCIEGELLFTAGVHLKITLNQLSIQTDCIAPEEVEISSYHSDSGNSTEAAILGIAQSFENFRKTWFGWLISILFYPVKISVVVTNSTIDINSDTTIDIESVTVTAVYPLSEMSLSIGKVIVSAEILHEEEKRIHLMDLTHCNVLLKRVDMEKRSELSIDIGRWYGETHTSIPNPFLNHHTTLNIPFPFHPARTIEYTHCWTRSPDRGLHIKNPTKLLAHSRFYQKESKSSTHHSKGPSGSHRSTARYRPRRQSICCEHEHQHEHEH